MNTEHRNKEFKIPHSTIEKYPFVGMPSKDATPKVDVLKDNLTGKVSIALDHEFFNTEGATEEYEKFIEELKARVDDKKTAFEDFLLFRLYEMREALTLAEQQIEDILEEHPFIPENLGFETVHKQASTQEQPQRIYGSKYSKGTFLFRKPGDVNDLNWNPSIWTLQQFKDNGDVTEDDVNLPCNRIAFAYFYAKGIQMVESVEKVDNA